MGLSNEVDDANVTSLGSDGELAVADEVLGVLSTDPAVEMLVRVWSERGIQCKLGG